jgi:uncharacterized protein YyaL (SSP411 family)
MKQKEGVKAALPAHNRLIHETSPYLLQHANNPVDWYPWGEEAFERARRDNKPLLLSIGYSACHWCHVMAHESFENEEIARLMNDNFVNIKVDREERPDLDQIYMNAVQMMTHHGGWPMTVFLTPDGVPFYGGTYFPPQDRYKMPGFPRILLSVAEAYRERPADIASTTKSLLQELRRLSVAGAADSQVSPELLESAYRGITKSYDPVEGGFGGAPKFPPAMTLEFLLRTYHRNTEEKQALAIVGHTCLKMGNGGIYDQLGGGFHRYATDAKWLVPHFEKMLYDNALLSRLYLHYFQVTQDPSARRIAEGILDYVLREMTHPAGGFYSSQDADSEGHEGKFFVWTAAEVEGLLGPDDARLFNSYFNITSEGNFEGKNILNITRSLEEVAMSEGVPVQHLTEILEKGRRVLFLEREKRVKPDRDDKVLTAWNGLMLISFSEAAAILGEERYLSAARKNADFLLTNLRRNGLLLRSWKEGQAKFNAYLEDYGFLIDGLLTLYETTGELLWFEEALALTRKMIAEFWDEGEGGFFFTGQSHEELIVRSKDYFDNATPSGNSVAAGVLLRLAALTGNKEYRDRAVTILRQVSDSARRYPTGFGWALSALDFYLSPVKELTLVGAEAADTRVLLQEVWSHYLPNKVVAVAAANDAKAQDSVSLLRERPLVNGKPTAYVCEDQVCQAPVTERDDLRKQLSR